MIFVYLSTPSHAVEGDLFLTLRGDVIDPGSDGGGIESEFLTAEAKNTRFLIGAAANDVGDTRWGYGILGAYLRLDDVRLNLYSRWEQGRGDSAGNSFVHSKISVGGTFAVIASRLYLDLGYQNIRSLSADDDVGRIGLSLAFPEGLLLSAVHDRSIGSADDTDSWLGRLDFSGPMRSYFVGASTGTVPVDPLVNTTGREDTEMLFAGVNLPLKNFRLTVSLTHQNGSGADRTSLFLTFNLPLKD
ncbi:MAG: hypothetical protein R3337_11020 [Gammaproteobacteria bacterium]|nr:hypothetical protein [Gammaproteobacteria bacterium]